MQHSQPQINTLLIVVALLAVAGGLAIVIVTSPQSWQYGPATWLQALIKTPTPFPTAVPPTTTPTAEPTRPTVTPTARPTGRVLTATPFDTETPTPEVTPTETPLALPTDVTALAVVTVQNADSARVRNQPGGDTIVAAVPSGTEVQVLTGKVEFNNVVWLQIRLPGGQVGWIADFLLRITKTFS